ncbi:ADP-forming succinate--CoA ligase subunit beta [Candidatus Aerophobetes bacterium]|uniref:Succinate--CoA ligase [ADP-forming] subunit beta n=1 Tax=Aerophobetes bacterium TaxID=2030807 RepID=A0A2A4X6H7_UNCAE|nr:MAG: ADP-forming succinate--CoA ligase subunit beta [Candidatus Aerophobetes bacterium]
MDTHEYQAKVILERYGLPIPQYGIAKNLDEAKKVIQDLNLSSAVVKIQVHAGGRGKAGGVKFAKTPEEILSFSEKLIGMKMVNNQTGPAGIVANSVLIADPIDIKKEFYLGAIIDRENAQAMIIASPEGGMNIEEVAEKYPEKILKIPIGLDGSLKSYHVMRFVKFMGFEKEARKQGAHIVKALAKAFIETDASLLEINPLVEDEEGKLHAIDAKLSVDENALFRQKEIASFYDATQIPNNEVEAALHDLAYIALEGDIGCMVNGAGLAMATMDIIELYGSKPANFLDVGGGANKEKVAAGFKIILSDPSVKAIFVNIFGGIMDCQTIAEGVIAAAKDLSVKVPLIVRLEGNNVEKGRETLKQSGLDIIAADSMNDGAKKAVASVKK